MLLIEITEFGNVKKKGHTNVQPFFYLAPKVGFEPTTN